MSTISKIWMALLVPLSMACSSSEPEKILRAPSFDGMHADLTGIDSLRYGSTYLSVYSEIYERTQDHTHQLTCTVSMRNISSTDTCYITSSRYYSTAGTLIKAYIEQPIALKPLETLEIIIARDDAGGGSGGNFVFEWATPSRAPSPLFEAIMISTFGQQGLSFATTGVER